MSNSQFNCLSLSVSILFTHHSFPHIEQFYESNRIESKSSVHAYKIRCKMLNANLKCHRQLLLSSFFQTIDFRCSAPVFFFRLFLSWIIKYVRQWRNFCFSFKTLQSFKPNWTGMKRRNKKLGKNSKICSLCRAVPRIKVIKFKLVPGHRS